MAAPILEVYAKGPTTVVGFGGRDVISDANVAACREELLQLMEDERCTTMAVDLTGVTFLPSGLLGLLASIRNHGAKVHLYNPCDEIREVLATTRLDTLMEIHDIAPSQRPES
ncbi:STAS domain-containing protein [Planctomicrobium sp. SH664]|uniref:STAS domain-containing protein n=1 Tax=Planctomicrobium sp. SH664 TaxID=3448125 RepID=UPI003F5BF71C